MKRLITLLFHDIYTDTPAESGFSGPAADRYKLSVQAFDSQLQAIARVRSDAPVLISGLTDETAGAAQTPFAVTVDDGGLSYYSLLADRLEARGWRGHCLVTTGRLGRPGFLQPHHVRELHDRGHLIGSHTVSHPARFRTCSWETLVEEWRRSKAELEAITGAAVIAGSVPGGSYSRRVAAAARAAGLSILFTSEPRTRLQQAGGCLIAGRYALRRESPASLAGSLVRREPGVMLREWAAWNGKKALKSALGGGYARLSGWLARRQQPGT